MTEDEIAHIRGQAAASVVFDDLTEIMRLCGRVHKLHTEFRDNAGYWSKVKDLHLQTLIDGALAFPRRVASRGGAFSEQAGARSCAGMVRISWGRTVKMHQNLRKIVSAT